MEIRKRIRMLFAIAAIAALMAAIPAASALAAPQEVIVDVQENESSFSIDLEVEVTGNSFAGIELGLAISDEFELEFLSFEKNPIYSEAMDSPFVSRDGIHYFGFFADSNMFDSGHTNVGTMNFGGYASDTTVTLILSHMLVGRVQPDGSAQGDQNTDPVVIFTVRRAGTGGGDGTNGGATPTPPPGQTGDPSQTPGTGDGATPATAPTPTPTPTPGPSEEPEVPALINEDETPFGVYFLKDHIQFITGYPDGTVRPDASITRAEAVTIFFRLIDDEDGKAAPEASSFNDVTGNEWHAQSVAYAAQKGIVLGYPDGSFRPNVQITRAEFATIMSRFVDASPTVARSFPDVPQNHWASQYINTCVASGWIIGYTDGTFRPESDISRAEAVTILNRALGRGIALEDIPENVPSFDDLPTRHWAYAQIIEASVTHEYERNASGTEVWDWD